MKLIIADTFWVDSHGTQGKMRLFYNPTAIPRVGERVAWFYEPTPTVTMVMHDYDNDSIIVTIK